MTRGAPNMHKVTRAFRSGESANSGAFRSDGEALWTYGVKICHREGGEIVWDIDKDNPPRYSVTSNRHINHVRAWVERDYPSVADILSRQEAS